jgi:dihydrofolate synthase/folylpolyglutamate synthase
MAMSPANAPIRTLEDAAAFLEGLVNHERQADARYERFNLAPIRRLLARVGDPQRRLSVVHIAGSKGKGSTALLTEAVLRAAGERVGTFTSPHLSQWTERFRIDGREVDGAALAAALESLRPHVVAVRAEDSAHAPTFFDVTTAAALLLFDAASLDRVVLEVGLGGRLDSTNVVDPAVACVTTIELEHTDKLGHSLAAIAAEKAGIVKPGRPVVVGALAPEAEAVVLARADAVGAPARVLGRDFQVEVDSADLEGLSLRLRDGEVAVDATLPLLGIHHATNAALALACVSALGAHDPRALADAVRRSFARVEVPGRIEVICRAPFIVVDGAHTAASARALAGALALVPRRATHLVLSISAGKDLVAILDALLPLADQVTVTRAEPSRSLDPAEIAVAARSARPGLALRVVPNPHLALRAARDAMAENGLLVASGSIYLAGLARRLWRAESSHRETGSR